MLAKYNNKIDIDGYSMLGLSVLILLATAGISYLFCLRKTYKIAAKTATDCPEDSMICVLGKKLVNEQPDEEYLSRLNRAKHILTDNAPAQALLLGGKTGDASISEAYAGQVFLLKANIDSSRIYLEEASRTTLENIHNALDFLQEKNKKIVIVTNRYHLARAKQMAEGFGLDVIVCAAEEKLNLNISSIFKMLIEALHVHWYISGHYYAHLTNNKNMIKRVG